MSLRKRTIIRTKIVWIGQYVTQVKPYVKTLTKKPLFKYIPKTFKKLVLVLAISELMLEASKKHIILKKILYIHNLIWFKKKKV